MLDQPVKIVFIDDDKLITDTWKESAENAGVILNVFHHPKDFIFALFEYSKETIIYLDSCLSDNLKGEDCAKKLYDLGYKNIMLATGYPKENFQRVTWIKDVISKNPPWG